MDLDCYDLSWEKGPDGLRVEALVDGGDGGKEVLSVPAPFDPYCYIEAADLETGPMKSVGCRLGDSAPEGFLRVEADHPRDIGQFDDRFQYQTYEADVGFARRVCIDGDVGIDRPGPEDILYFDIEVDDRGTFTEPDDASDRVIAIAAVGGDGEEHYFDDEDEEALIDGFFEAADDYVALAGWNSVGYDFEYLENRVLAMGKSVNWRRWVKHDVMPLYDMLAVPTKEVSTKLGDTGERELGVGKTGVEPGGGRLWELWNEDPDELREYNVRDADLVRRIDREYDLVELLHTICDLCSFPPGEACYESKHGQVRFAIGQVVDAKLLETANRKGIPQRNKRSYDKPDEFPGGYVLDTVPGVYEGVVVPDYSGMYPNIVRSFNFGEETWAPTEAELRAEHGADVRVIEGESGVFVHPDTGPRSVPAESADELVEMREGAPEIVDKGVKAVNNTLYGVFAADHQRYFGPHSENITLIGQELTGIVEELAGAGHELIKKVIYGDTDSVMIEMADGVDDPVGAARRIASDLEEQMQAWARERNAVARHLELDVDDVYDKFYIGDKKKRYFGHRIWSDGEERDDHKIRGFEARQGSWPRPCRDMQEELLRAKLHGGDQGAIIDEYEARLRTGEWDLEMATSKKLGQPVDEYAHPLPHTRAAQAIRARFGDGTIRVGDKVDHIKYGPDKTDVTWVHNDEIGEDFRPNEGWCPECGEVVRRGGHGHDTEDHPHFRESHYGHLWREKFVSVMESIDVEQHDQATLGAFG